METYYVNDESFKNSKVFIDYLKNNSSIGYLKVRSYTANEAIPIKGVEITITKEIENANIVFFRGLTDDSGLIEKIPLPAPKLDTNNLEAPNGSKYILEATYNGQTTPYNITIYENVYVVQTINITPKINMGGF